LEGQTLIDKEELYEIVKSAFIKHGVKEQHATIVTNSLVDASLRGVETHGVILVKTYIERLKAGSINPIPKIEEVKEGMNISVLDGDNGLGQVTSYHAMELAIKKSKDSGIGIVGVRNSNHFGTASFYSTLAANKGIIGVVFSNASARLAPWGGKTPVYGNNPWSIAVPVEGSLPIVLDIANSVVAFSKILTAARKGEDIPIGWAMDEEGNRTENPNEAKLLLPFGDHKGYGIAVMIEIFSAILTGSAFGKEVGLYNSLEKGQNVGHLFMALNIEAFFLKKIF
jgi:ureidoglycolate dehydrogenase (NAD+)